jgi:adenylate cyclase
MASGVEHFTDDDPFWRGVLTGELPELRRGRYWFRLLSPRVLDRCRLCYAPFAGPLAPLMRWIGRGPWARNPHFCDLCEQAFRHHRGGTTLEIGVLFADVRGSTPLAAQLGPVEFGALMQRFYVTATRTLTRADGTIDKMVGDEVIALFFPGLIGGDFRRTGIEAGLELLRATGHGGASRPWLSIGVAVHAGPAFVGSLGVEGGTYEFVALGDTMNVGARLCAAAEPGELLVSAAAWTANSPATGAQPRTLTLKGVDQPIAVRALRAARH